ncbi:hypothetical protein MPH_04224 [Macrophomina phaseolina MS6]|uniref:Uncharacterized protein n=1 Tax=Macrophomina phaseolina (strain MS6) TaxID=1126212 RepID=K2S0D4_MACPH|nr:hypothetical protein MPH_04224 [Macrophomina phaseolina MS6]
MADSGSGVGGNARWRPAVLYTELSLSYHFQTLALEPALAEHDSQQPLVGCVARTLSGHSAASGAASAKSLDAVKEGLSRAFHALYIRLSALEKTGIHQLSDLLFRICPPQAPSRRSSSALRSCTDPPPTALSSRVFDFASMPKCTA